jgi:CubicO group peptidase (beta-lactamase class C family)
VLDMTGSVEFSEDYTDFSSDIFTYSFAMGSLQPPPEYAGPETICEFLKSLKKGNEEHGAGFVYRTVHSDVLGWIISRITGKHFAELMSENIWQKLGMEKDAYILIDPVGTPWQGSGLCATARDLARFAEMVRLGGELNGQRFFAKEAVDEIRKGGDRKKFKSSGMDFRDGYSYHNQWWLLHNADGAFEASGLFGQMIHINPGAKMVVVKLSTHPVPGAGFTHPLTLRAWDALAEAVRQ